MGHANENAQNFERERESKRFCTNWKFSCVCVHQVKYTEAFELVQRTAVMESNEWAGERQIVNERKGESEIAKS